MTTPHIEKTLSEGYVIHSFNYKDIRKIKDYLLLCGFNEIELDRYLKGNPYHGYVPAYLESLGTWYIDEEILDDIQKAINLLWENV